MKRLSLLCLILTLLAPCLCARPRKPGRKPGLYAIFQTSMGTFVCELYEKQAPNTVANFTALAQGTKEWLTTKGDFVKKPFYDGLIFHRVVRRFAIQAGDITGTGGNFPAVIAFENEIVATLVFSGPGMLAMANAGGTKTNTTQFFVTVAPAAHLDGKHTIFGKVVEGYSVVENISNVPVLGSKPVKDVRIQKVTIERVGRK